MTKKKEEDKKEEKKGDEEKKKEGIQQISKGQRPRPKSSAGTRSSNQKFAHTMGRTFYGQNIVVFSMLLTEV